VAGWQKNRKKWTDLDTDACRQEINPQIDLLLPTKCRATPQHSKEIVVVVVDLLLLLLGGAMSGVTYRCCCCCYCCCWGMVQAEGLPYHFKLVYKLIPSTFP
jgi:hypothetical protein